MSYTAFHAALVDMAKQMYKPEATCMDRFYKHNMFPVAVAEGERLFAEGRRRFCLSFCCIGLSGAGASSLSSRILEIETLVMFVLWAVNVQRRSDD